MLGYIMNSLCKQLIDGKFEFCKRMNTVGVNEIQVDSRVFDRLVCHHCWVHSGVSLKIKWFVAMDFCQDFIDQICQGFCQIMQHYGVFILVDCLHLFFLLSNSLVKGQKHFPIKFESLPANLPKYLEILSVFGGKLFVQTNHSFGCSLHFRPA